MRVYVLRFLIYLCVKRKSMFSCFRENADLLPDPESLTLDALLSPLDMGPSLREVTNAYAHNLFRRQTDPATLRENSHPTKGYNRVPSLGVRSFNNVKPGYSSVDRTRQMRPPKPETKRVVSESSAAFVPNGNEKSSGQSANTESNGNFKKVETWRKAIWAFVTESKTFLVSQPYLLEKKKLNISKYL